MIDLTGKTFDSWTAIERVAACKKHHPHWLCRCECGSERAVSGANLRSGASTNCGCKRQHTSKHGHAKRSGRTETYLRWKAMHARCSPDSAEARNYFDRGIGVDPRWSDFVQFLEDVGECPNGMTLDRIDNDRGYGPGNCRWATRYTQRRNSRRLTFVAFDGREMLVTDAASSLGVTDTAIYQERSRNGGSVQEAFDRVCARRLA